MMGWSAGFIMMENLLEGRGIDMTEKELLIKISEEVYKMQGAIGLIWIFQIMTIIPLVIIFYWWLKL